MKRTILTAFITTLLGFAGCATGTPPTTQVGSISCNTPTDCPIPEDRCTVATCNNKICGTTLVPEGTPIPDSLTGDCKARVCDKVGDVVEKNDDMDIPNDNNACTLDACMAGMPSHSPVAEGSPCSDGNGTQCNAIGACVQCITAADCPGQDTECEKRTCFVGSCGVEFTAAGTPVASQIPGDCAEIRCDGTGSTTVMTNNMDLPDDNNDCTANQCVAGAPMNPVLPADTTCTQDGGQVCNANGACVQCNMNSQCASKICNGNICRPASCGDGILNGTETDFDCGGADCPACPLDSECVKGTDCITGVCIDALCAPPAVVATIPASGQTDVAVTATVAVQFSGSMDAASLTAQTEPGPCTGSMQVSTDGFVTCIGFSTAMPVMSSGNSIATWTPSPALSQGSTYSVRVTTAARSTDNAQLSAQYTSPMGFVTGVPTTMCNSHVVISQVYGNGGASGASFENDFIELHNRGTAAVDVSKWSVQYASPTGSTWIVVSLTGSIPAGGYYLIKAGSSGTTGPLLPTPDVTEPTNIGASAGKLALVQNTTALKTDCPTMGTNIVDFVGYGNANCSEGANKVVAPSSAGHSMQRLGSGCVDTNNNKADFMTATAIPRNTKSTPFICSCLLQGSVNETNLAGEVDLCSIDLPATLSVTTQTATPTIFGRVFETGVTEAAGANTMVKAEVGFGPASINPTTQSGWQFFPAMFGMQSGTADEYRGSFTAPAPGTYRYTLRASVDGTQWTYCDLNGAGSSTGAIFEVTQLPTLTVTP